MVESIDAIFDKNMFSSIPKPNDLILSTMTTSNGHEHGDKVELRRSWWSKKDKSLNQISLSTW